MVTSILRLVPRKSLVYPSPGPPPVVAVAAGDVGVGGFGVFEGDGPEDVVVGGLGVRVGRGVEVVALSEVAVGGWVGGGACL